MVVVLIFVGFPVCVMVVCVTLPGVAKVGVRLSGAGEFHPEGDIEEFILRIDTYRNHGYFVPDEAKALKKKVSRKHTPYAQEMLKRFVGRYFIKE